MEKRSPAYALKEIQAAFQDVTDLHLRMSYTARADIFALGLSLKNVVFIIQSLTPKHFYKSMTTYADHKVWQDVYHFKYHQLTLYIKFTKDPKGPLLVSFKEK